MDMNVDKAWSNDAFLRIDDMFGWPMLATADISQSTPADHQHAIDQQLVRQDQ